MNTQVDLSQLAIDRRPAARKPRAAGSRVWLTRYVLPATVLGGFASLLLWSAREHFLPAAPVTTIPVLATRSEVQRAGLPLFNAAGWIEPRPTLMQVSALAEGVVEKLLVVEGQEVHAGDPIAKLVEADAQFALSQASDDRELRKAELQSAEAGVAAAKSTLEFPTESQTAVAEADALLAKAIAEQQAWPQQVRSAEARLLLAQQDLDGKKSVTDVISERQMQRVRSEVVLAQSATDELRVHKPHLDEEIEALQRKVAALRKRLELKIVETRGLADAQANLTSAQARLRQAEVAIKTAELRLSRMTVRAPIDGRILQLTCQPGSRMMGQTAVGAVDASTLVTMYDPQNLQVRADVRLEDLPRVQSGAPVKISTAALASPIDGTVLRATSSADVQKNTLAVKISILDPPAVIKPEMLVQVVFLAPESANHAEQPNELLRLLIPRQLVIAGDGSKVWIADQAAGAARLQSITLGQTAQNDMVEVTAGLTAADKLLVEGRQQLRDGQRISIRGEDSSLGVGSKAVAPENSLEHSSAHH